MPMNARLVSFVGFGEAGQAFALTGTRAYDMKPERAADWPAPADALSGARAVISAVTADQAFAAACAYAPLLDRGTLWLDMNSVAPGTKRAAADAIEAAGARYADVAVMAPVHPARLAVPLLVAGPHAEDAAALLRDYGFSNMAIAGPRIGDASAIKMIRSVMVKGIEALSAECLLAAEQAGVSGAVLASLDASWREQSWRDRIDYNLDRMLEHGMRRAAEMEEVTKTLAELGVEPLMARAAMVRQREIGALGIAPPPGLEAKLSAIATDRKDRAA